MIRNCVVIYIRSFRHGVSTEVGLDPLIWLLKFHLRLVVPKYDARSCEKVPLVLMNSLKKGFAFLGGPKINELHRPKQIE